MKTKEKADTSSPPPEKVLYDNRIKRKNVLALNEKVAAIREYEKMPVYKRIGRMFHCSPDQIKRIVQQKETILKAWEQRTRRCQDAKTLEMKVVRVSMLGKAVYDWIRRMMYYKDLMITDGLIQKMALQFKSAMGLQNFFPHQDWCDKFRNTYNITESDSKLLNIGYTQGYSVQIKDVMKDVLSECTPDVIEDDDTKDENENDREINKTPTMQKFKLKSTVAQNSSTDGQTDRIMPKLKTLPQMVTFPLQGTPGLGMVHKVIVATPISTGNNNHMNKTSPMTMTIIPLTTIPQSQPSNAQIPTGSTSTATAAVGNEKQTVPPPMVQIKQEIKEEPEEDEPVFIKQEYISDSEDVQEISETSPLAMQNQHTAEQPTSIKASKAFSTTKISTSNKKEKSYEENNDAMDTMDYDNLALASLRKLMQNQNTSTVTAKTSAIPTIAVAKVEQTQANLHSIVANVVTASSSSVPQNLTLTPASVSAKSVIRTANKRKRNTDSPTLPPIKTFAEARKYLKLLEDFALDRENYRLIGLITRADEVLRELDKDDDVDVD